MKHILTIAGSDSGGGAGIQADLKVISALGAYGMTVITAITAQNTRGVTDVRELDPDIVEAQIRAVFDDIPVHGVKVGMVGNAVIIERIADLLTEFAPHPLVIDPVMVAQSGHNLLASEALEALTHRLLPLADLITPNIPEAEVLLGRHIKDGGDMKEAATELAQRLGSHVLVKGGHLNGPPCDVLSTGTSFLGERIPTRHTHGTGCSLSSALTVYLAQGYSLEEAVEQSKSYVASAIQHAFPVGKGNSPIHHFHAWHPSEVGGTNHG
ncbi:hydroxymethylpyrimidine/phosphomethylpyrimidine kinase [Marininema mesophilum]|uniref:Hydroxymethylpyrimidine/phosphomethylpyrimidine kinase n=1 Tax=Marininema mesophilum TaxID=1048340 RepID=A0A1H2ZGV7_9BACL|nr:bifunctional hydroxymethylpyrimidine kinase/phosphomethylpyrimidine kinase [Marininema mesophilum]SDX16611.1 hydroxymethylpyrimidine/phosphomethylpyrimidine kinase [Marininema mesophilum]